VKDSEVSGLTGSSQKKYTARDIYWIVRMQAMRRGLLVRRQIRSAEYTPGHNYEEGDFENVNVQVSSNLLISSF